MAGHVQKSDVGGTGLVELSRCTGSAAEVTPVREIDHRVIGDPGPITQTIQQKYFAIVKGEDEKYFDWLDFVAT